MSRSTDRSSDPSPFAWIMAGAVAAVGLGSLLAARRRKRAEQDLWATADDPTSHTGAASGGAGASPVERDGGAEGQPS